MAMGTGYCPSCGVKYNARESSIGTVKRCQACGYKFILQAMVPEVPVGYFSFPRIIAASGVGAVVLLLLIVAAVFLFAFPGSHRDSITSQSPTPTVVEPTAPSTSPALAVVRDWGPATTRATIGVDRSPAPSPGSIFESTGPPTSLLTLAGRIDQAKAALAADGAALTSAEDALLQRLTKNPQYAATLAMKETASAVARAAGHGDGDLVAASHDLGNATQQLGDLRRAGLDHDPAVIASRAKVNADETVLIALLKEQGVPVVVEMSEDGSTSASLIRKPSSAAAGVAGSSIAAGSASIGSRGYVNGSAGGAKDVFVQSYYRKDGTYVSSHMRSSAGSGSGRGHR